MEISQYHPTSGFYYPGITFQNQQHEKVENVRQGLLNSLVVFGAGRLDRALNVWGGGGGVCGLW